MMTDTHLPPPPAPLTTLQVISRFLDLVGASGGTAEGVKLAALEIEKHNDELARHELAKQQHELRMKADREQLAREREAFQASMADRERALKTQIEAFEARQARAQEQFRRANELLNEVRAMAPEVFAKADIAAPMRAAERRAV